MESDNSIRELDGFLFEFEGYLYYTKNKKGFDDRITHQRILEKKIGFRKGSQALIISEFLEILRAYLRSIKK